MLAKNAVQQQQQQQQRRTPLSLSTSMKPTKSNDKNDNNRKETTNNQKTDFSKKDSKRSISTSSDSKKVESNKNKTNKNEDNKKNQNGVNGNGIQDKLNAPNANESSSNGSNGNASKEDSKTQMDKKMTLVVDLTEENDNKKASETAEVDETKVEETKAKSAEDNNKKNIDTPKSKIEQEKTNEKPEENTPKKKTNVNKEEKEKTVVEIKSSEQTEGKDTKIIEQEVKEVPACETQQQNTDLTTENTKETTEKKDEEVSKLEKPSTDVLEDVEMMEPLQFVEEPASSTVFAVSTPAKSCSPKEAQSLFEVPSKLSPKSEVKPSKTNLTHTPDRKSCPRSFSAISGRRSIRPIGDYTFSGNLQIRESYRKINTELDFTTSSLNVTVGSEVPNNESFSFLSRSRKRDRSSPTHQPDIEVQSELSPKSPKRARIDLGMSGFFSAMASPITMLRARLARTSVQTPKKQIVDPVEQEIVENVSSLAVEAIEEDLTATEEQTFNPDSTVADTNEQNEEFAKPLDEPIVEESDDIKIKETITPTESQSKKKCSIM